MVKPVRKNSERQRLCLRLGLVLGITVDQDARQFGYLGDPPTVIFPFDFHQEIHE
jgi:hypothetical protein